MTMTNERLKELIQPPVLGVLSTVNPDGSPQSTPIWYRYDGEHFNVTAFKHRVKVRNVRGDPRVSLVVVDTANNGPPLIVNGKAEIVEEGALDETLRHAIRYDGEEQGRASAANLTGSPRVIIQISPDRIIG